MPMDGGRCVVHDADDVDGGGDGGGDGSDDDEEEYDVDGEGREGGRRER